MKIKIASYVSLELNISMIRKFGNILSMEYLIFLIDKAAFLSIRLQQIILMQGEEKSFGVSYGKVDD